MLAELNGILVVPELVLLLLVLEPLHSFLEVADLAGEQGLPLAHYFQQSFVLFVLLRDQDEVFGPQLALEFFAYRTAQLIHSLIPGIILSIAIMPLGHFALS